MIISKFSWCDAVVCCSGDVRYTATTEDTGRFHGTNILGGVSDYLGNFSWQSMISSHAIGEEIPFPFPGGRPPHKTSVRSLGLGLWSRLGVYITLPTGKCVFFPFGSLISMRSDVTFPSDASNHTHKSFARACPRASLRTRRSLPPAPRPVAYADLPRAAVMDRRRRGAGPCHHLRCQALRSRRPCPPSPPSPSHNAQI